MDATVVLTKVDLMQPDGRYVTKWTGDVPLRWRHQELYPLQRTIGSPIDCDLIVATNMDGVNLPLVLFPNNLQSQWTRPIDALLHVALRHRDGLSEGPLIRITWDGNWNSGEMEMSQHLTVAIIE
jgi:hypothetical protein